MVKEVRICPKCNKKYSFNPSVGQIYCPRCGKPYLGIPVPLGTCRQSRWPFFQHKIK